MKNILTITFFFILSASMITAQVRVTSEGFLQVDYNGTDQSLTFGDNPYPAQPRGRWAIEHWTGGLNYWIPWPSAGAGSYKLFLEDASGFVGINDSDPSYHLDVNGDIQLSGQIRYYSDERLKTNIRDIGNSIEKLKNLNGVSYKMKKSMLNKYDITGITDPVKLKTIEAETSYYNDSVIETARYGFIAQELKKVFPELVDENEEGYLNIDYVGLIPVLVEAIKELEAKIINIENNCCNKAETLKSGSINTNLLSPGVMSPMLYQNNPNPFSVQTTIKFEIPETVQGAQIHICNMTGTLLKTITINQRQSGSVTINANEFVAGMYLYSLVCDGKIVDTKQMMLTQ
jgi:hypothetical protein